MNKLRVHRDVLVSKRQIDELYGANVIKRSHRDKSYLIFAANLFHIEEDGEAQEVFDSINNEYWTNEFVDDIEESAIARRDVLYVGEENADLVDFEGNREFMECVFLVQKGLKKITHKNEEKFNSNFESIKNLVTQKLQQEPVVIKVRKEDD